MSLLTVAAICHIAKNAPCHEYGEHRWESPTESTRKERRLEAAKDIAFCVLVSLVVAGCVLGGFMAEQAGLAWLAFLLYALFAIIMLGGMAVIVIGCLLLVLGCLG